MSAPTPEFVALVKSAAEQLHDCISLRTHPLADILCGHLPPGNSRARGLRQALLDAIDSTRTNADLSTTDPRRQRDHQVLELRYVEALSYQEVMDRLCLSQPQYHRYQRHAVEALALILWQDAAVPGAHNEHGEGWPPTRLVSGHAEPDTLSRGDGVFDLKETVERAVAVLRSALVAAGIELDDDLPGGPVVVSGNQIVARQLTIALAGFALTLAPGSAIRLTMRAEDVCVTIVLVCRGASIDETLASERARAVLGLARQLAESLSGLLTVHAIPGAVTLAVTLPPQPRSLLVIDDNPRLAPLLRRLIADRGYLICAALDARSGLEIARAIRPSIVLLDIVMPGQDGWDALLALKGDPRTASIPVVVLSVLAEPQVALRLGAEAFLEKPLQVESLFAILDRCIERSSPRRRSGEQTVTIT